ncbi:MAG: cation diffusion facilitator family transporter [Bacteroidota bacterium]
MAGSKKGPIYAAMAANTGIAIAKFIGASISGSSAMLAEGIHSLVDTGNGLLLLLGISRSKKPADKKHPFGRGKEIYFWSLIVAILIFALGGGMSFYEGIEHIRHPKEMGDPTLNYIILGLAIVFEGAALVFAVRSFNDARRRRGRRNFWTAIQQSKDPASFAVIFEDTAALVGLLIALGGIFLSQTLNQPIWDGIASVLIGLLLAGIAIFLTIETKALLIGEAAFPEVRESIAEIVDGDDAVNNINPPMTMHMGPDDILLALDVEFKDELSADDIEAAIQRIEKALKEKHPQIKRIFIEARSLANAVGQLSGGAS